MAKLLRVTGAAVLAAALAVLPGHAQQQTGQAQGQSQPQAPPPPTGPDGQPIFRAGINFVRVDVIVTDKNGNPVDNLKPEDFELVEEGKPQKIETFKLIALDGGLMSGCSPSSSTIITSASRTVCRPAISSRGSFRRSWVRAT